MERKNNEIVDCSYSMLRFLNELVAGADHEINNLLLMLQGSGHILLDSNPSPEKRKLAIEGIRTKTLRIQEVMTELRAVLKDGSNDPIKTSTVRELTTKAISLCRTRFKNHRIIFSLNISESLKVDCKETQIVQALLAVLSSSHNAIMQTTDKWVKVEVFELENEVVMEVEDSGVAFLPSETTKIFQPFYHSESGRTGAGLALAKHLIENHQGTMEALNVDGRPVVRITIPRYQEETAVGLAVPVEQETIEVYDEQVITVKSAA